MNTLPLVLRGASKIGWYEGGGFFVIMSESARGVFFCSLGPLFINVLIGILNYKWSITGIYDIYDKSMAGILTTMLAAAGAAYWRSNDRPTAITLGVVAVLQGLGLRNGSYSRLT